MKNFFKSAAKAAEEEPSFEDALNYFATSLKWDHGIPRTNYADSYGPMLHAFRNDPEKLIEYYKKSKSLKNKLAYAGIGAVVSIALRMETDSFFFICTSAVAFAHLGKFMGQLQNIKRDIAQQIATHQQKANTPRSLER